MTASPDGMAGTTSSNPPAAPSTRRRRLWTLAAVVIAALAWLVVLGQVVDLGPTVADRVQLALGIGYPERTGPPMLVIAHRGDVDRYPENTLEAIEAAAQGAADGIEIDVQRSADGVWYVIHDPTLDRTSDLSGDVNATTSDEVDAARIDGGLGYRPEHLGLGVPRLTEVLEALDDYEGLLVIDIKHAETGIAGEVAQLLAGRPATMLVGSAEDVEGVRRVDPGIQTVAFTGVAPGMIDGYLMHALAEATIGRVRASDLPVWTYVHDGRFDTDETDLIRRAWAAGVYAYLSKQPEQAAATVAEWSEGR